MIFLICSVNSCRISNERHLLKAWLSFLYLALNRLQHKTPNIHLPNLYLDLVDLRSIKVYYMLDDGGDPVTSPVSSDISEAMKNVVNILSKECLVVEEVNLKCIKFGYFIMIAYLSKVRDQRISNAMRGDVKNDESNFLQKEMLKWLFGMSEHTLPILLQACWQDFLQDFLNPLITRPSDFFCKCGDEMRAELLNILQPEPAVFLYPTFPHVAAHHGQMLVNSFNTSYTAIFNAIALPSTQCPLGFSSSGLPCGMQIVTAPNNDRLSIAIAEYLEEKIGGWVEPS